MSEATNTAENVAATAPGPFDASAVTLSKIDAKRLTDTHTANAEKKPFFAVAKEMSKLVKLGLVIGYADSKNPAKPDQIAFSITENGSAVIDGGKAREAMDAAARVRAPVPTNGFEIEDNVNMPAVSATGRVSMYPFEALGVGQGFFVDNNEGRQDAYKSLSSTVSQKNKDGASQNPQKVFRLARGTKTVNGVEVKGAWVKRES